MSRTIDPHPTWYMPCGYCKAPVAVYLTKTRRGHYVCNGNHAARGEHCARHLTMGRRETDEHLAKVDAGKLPTHPPGKGPPASEEEVPVGPGKPPRDDGGFGFEW